MSIEILIPTELEPVTLAEAKARLRVDQADEDSLIAALIASARERIETLTARALIERTLVERRDRFDAPVISLSQGPVLSIERIDVLSADGAASRVEPSRYTIDARSHPPRLATRDGGAWPSPGRRLAVVEIEYVAGYGPSPESCPAALRDAILALVADAYEARAPFERGDEAALPPLVAGLIAPYVGRRL